MRAALSALTRRSGFEINRALAAGVSLAVVVVLFAAAFNECTYSARSDSSMYLGQMLKIRNGYLAENLAAMRWAGPPEEAPAREALGTEGGYAFLLHLINRTLGDRATFHVNSVLMPLTALVNGAVAGQAEVAPEEKRDVVFRLPAASLREGMNRLELRTRGWRPADLDKSEDARELGVYVRSITLAANGE